MQKRRPFLLIPMMLIAVAMVFALGLCQLEQRERTLALIQVINARMQDEPVSLSRVKEVLSKSGDVDYTRVLLVGSFKHEEERHLHTVVDDQEGWNILTPLITSSGDTVLVNRGFVPDDHKDPATRKEGMVSGTVELLGVVHTSEPKGWFKPANDPAANRWFWMDVPALAASLNTSNSAEAGQLNNVAPFIVEAEAANIPGGWPRARVTPLAISNHHLGYAIGWFVFAGLLALFFAFHAKRRFWGQQVGGNAKIAPTRPGV